MLGLQQSTIAMKYTQREAAILSFNSINISLHKKQ